MILYPAVDIRNGKAVRLDRGDFSAETVYDDDPLAVRGDDLVEEVDVVERRGAEDHPGRAGAQRVADGGQRAQAAADLDRNRELVRDPLDVVEVRGLAGPRAVEVDDVQEARPGLDPGTGGLERIVLVDGLGGEVALVEADGLAVADVDGGIEDQGAGTPVAMRTKLPSSCSPCVDDFSGWHCAPKMCPRSTKDTNGEPYSPVPSTTSSSAGSGA